MNPQDILLIKSSFALVAPNAELFASKFYARLFDYDPTLRPLFRGDLVEQGKKLTQLLAVIVRGLDRLDAFLPAVRSLGERHASYGVTPAHYDTVAAALIFTLNEFLGDAFTPDVANAWTVAYGALADQMIAGSTIQSHQRVA
jgi:hemoglobin-like flavoprotein